MALHVTDFPVPVGAMVHMAPKRGDTTVLCGEVVGFDQHQTVVMLLGSTDGVRRGDTVIADQHKQTVYVG